MTQEHEDWCHAEIKNLSAKIEQLTSERKRLATENTGFAIENTSQRAEIERWKTRFEALQTVSFARAAEVDALRTLLNAVRIWMKNIDRRESEEPLYRAICTALHRPGT